VVFGCPCPSLLPAPGGPSAAPAAVGGGVGFGSLLRVGVRYGWFCLCRWFVPWCRHYCPAFVLRLVWARRALPSGAGWSPAPACLFVPFGSFALASVFARSVSVLGWRVWVRPGSVGSPVFAACGLPVPAFAVKVALPFGLSPVPLARLAAGSVPVFAGGARCLVCPAWSRWPVRGFFPRPVPRWWCGLRRILPPAALRLSWVAALAPMRRCYLPSLVRSALAVRCLSAFGPSGCRFGPVFGGWGRVRVCGFRWFRSVVGRRSGFGSAPGSPGCTHSGGG